eukprot:1380419-Prymnesium_polylepis.1
MPHAPRIANSVPWRAWSVRLRARRAACPMGGRRWAPTSFFEKKVSSLGTLHVVRLPMADGR